MLAVSHLQVFLDRNPIAGLCLVSDNHWFPLFLTLLLDKALQGSKGAVKPTDLESQGSPQSTAIILEKLFSL